jgi:hypothetical protein
VLLKKPKQKSLGSRSINLIKDTQVFTLEITSQEIITNKIIPLFESDPLKGTINKY